MGRRRRNCGQTNEKVPSDVTLNDGDISSGTESESSTIREAHREPTPTGLADVRQNRSILSVQSQCNDENVNLTQAQGTPSHVNIGLNRLHSNAQSSSLGNLSIPMPLQCENTTSGHGDETRARENTESVQLKSLLQKTMSECMTGVESMLRQTCESMKECVNGVAYMVKDSNAQNRAETQHNFQELLKEIREMNGKRNISLESSSGNSFQTECASHVLQTSQRSGHVSGARSASHSSQSPDHYIVTSLPLSSTSLAPTVNYDHSAVTAASISSIANTGPSNIVSPATQPQSVNQFVLPGTNMPSYQPFSTGEITVPRSSNDAADINNSKQRYVKLPTFSGTSSDSWKVWYARFTTVANLYSWDEKTRLSELIQRLQGTAAEFVFDEIPADRLTSFDHLVSELDSRFKCVETNKTYRVQFGKRVQRYNETAEEYSAELKRLYDKAYPGRNPEMRRQLLLQQFLNGLRDKEAKFAVEYYKEPISIEDAVLHVVTYTEAQQGQKADSRHHNYHSKTIRFDDDDDFGTTRARSLSYSPSARNRQTLREVKNTPPKAYKRTYDAKPMESTSRELDILQKLLSLAENKSSEGYASKTPAASSYNNRSYNSGQGRSYNPGQGQGWIKGQGHDNGPGNQGQGHNNGLGQPGLQCYYCLESGHFKRNCPVLKAEQNLAMHASNYTPNRSQPPILARSHRGPMQAGANDIDLN